MGNWLLHELICRAYTVPGSSIQAPGWLRRYSSAYRYQQKRVRFLWGVHALLALLIQHPAWLAASTLFTVFLSFCILDETAS
ncbi:hypothetical protein AAIA72_03210 [Hahella sp. SMD15-11]|uniref:Uncharacterized protein n=1 Tax=Thermohahella caldifontis TaxID=3142973 RepID=A0AB39UYR2_9GAMM